MLLHRYKISGYDYNSMTKLAAHIREATGNSISVNTLTRIAGIRSDNRNSYRHTLDLLANAAVLYNYDHYLHFLKQKTEIRLLSDADTVQPFMVEYTQKAAASGDIRFLKELLNHIEKSGCSVDNLFLLSAALGKGLRKNKSPRQVIQLLSRSRLTFELFFENHVDRDYFNSYYGACMAEASKYVQESDHLFLFTNSIALFYEKKIGQQSSYLKRGKKLLAVTEKQIDALLEKRWIYPVARWLAAGSDYLYTKRENQKANQLIEKILEYSPSLTPDERMIFLSETSEIAHQIHTPLRHELQKIFVENKPEVLVEFDSLCNAGLNFSASEKAPPLITSKEVKNLTLRYPYQFAMCRSSILKKASKLTP